MSELVGLPKAYSEARVRKSSGAHYTPEILADFVSEAIVRALEAPTGRKLGILDPAAGDGALLHSLLRELREHGYNEVEVHGFDTDPAALTVAKSRIERDFPGVSLTLELKDFLTVIRDYFELNRRLFDETEKVHFDLVIANPPYVRTQVMGSNVAQRLARQFGLSGRVDLYHAFILGIGQALKPGGVGGVIVSNRFMTTRSGGTVRKAIQKSFDVLHVWDLGDTQLFEAAVLPAVLLLRKKSDSPGSIRPEFTSIYSSSAENTEHRSENAITALSLIGTVETANGRRYVVKHGKLEVEDTPEGVWRISTLEADQWLARVSAHTYETFNNIGNIRVGVKTTADFVFIRSDWDEMPEEKRPELLRPLITHHVARRYRAIEPNKYKILYTHEMMDGRRAVVDLSRFPKSARYLEEHRKALEARDYVRESGRKWFEIWVPQDPSAWEKPKIVFRDISEKPTFWLDPGGSVVNGDCYWVTCKNGNVDILWLALAVGNSSFIEVFYDHRFNNKLYSNRRRFMTQYVKDFPLPDPNSKMAKDIVQTVKDLFGIVPSQRTGQVELELDEMVWNAFGFSLEEVTR